MSDKIDKIVVNDTEHDAWAVCLDIYWQPLTFSSKRSRHKFLKKFIESKGAVKWNHEYCNILDMSKVYIKDRDIAAMFRLGLS